MAKRMKRLFPREHSASYVRTSRMDISKAIAYNQQRSKATVGSGPNTQHKMNNSFMEPIPPTIGRHVHHIPWWELEDPPEDIKQKKKLKTENPVDKRFWQDRKKGEPLWPEKKVVITPRGQAIEDKHEETVYQTKKESGEVLSYYKVWQSDKRQGIVEYYCTVLKQSTGYRLMMFHSGREHLFVQESEKENIRRVSRTYMDRDEAMSRYRAFENGGRRPISWILSEPMKS